MNDKEFEKMLQEDFYKSLFGRPKNVVKVNTHCLVLKISEKLRGQERFIESIVNNPFPTDINEGE